MLIEAGTEIGNKVEIFDKDGNPLELLLKSYDTETKEAVIYVIDPITKMQKMTPWEQLSGDGLKGTRTFLTETTVLEGSYAVIDGKRIN